MLCSHTHNSHVTQHVLSDPFHDLALNPKVSRDQLSHPLAGLAPGSFADMYTTVPPHRESVAWVDRAHLRDSSALVEPPPCSSSRSPPSASQMEAPPPSRPGTSSGRSQRRGGPLRRLVDELNERLEDESASVGAMTRGWAAPTVRVVLDRVLQELAPGAVLPQSVRVAHHQERLCTVAATQKRCGDDMRP